MLDPRGHGTILGGNAGRDFFSPTSSGASSGSFLSQSPAGNDFFGPSNFGGGGDVRELGAGTGGFNPFTDQSDPHSTQPQNTYDQFRGGAQASPEGIRDGFIGQSGPYSSETSSPWSAADRRGQMIDQWGGNNMPLTGESLRAAADTPRVPNPGASDPANPFGYSAAPWGSPGNNAWGAAPGPAAPPPAPAGQPAAPRASAGPAGPRMQRTAGSGGYYGA